MSVAPGNQNSTKNSVLPNFTSQSERNKKVFENNYSEDKNIY
jgi:hypothetical protein